MNLICPHCQKPLTVSEDKAGQTMACPLCNQTFQVPALPQTAQLSFDYEELPEEIPLVPLPPEAEKPPAPQPPQPPVPEEPLYEVVPEPAQPAPSAPPRRPKPSRPNAQQRPTGPSPVKPPPSVPATGYEQVRSLLLRPEVITWIAPVSLVLLFVLLWVAWVGVYPGGYGVYTQNGFQAWLGSHSWDPVGEKVMGKEQAIEEHISANWFLMTLYLLLLLAALALSIASVIWRSAKAPLVLPPTIERIWPWRTALVGALSALAFLILLLLLLSGLGLEKAVTEIVDQGLEKDYAAAQTSEEKQKVNIKRGLELGWYNLHRTGWLTWVIVLQLAAAGGAGLELWLEKRGTRPPPRIELQW
jgi:hypothetical protein